MRLLTRSDFDGLVCAALLEEAGVIDEHKFVHPKDIQDGKIPVTANDVLANIPYAAGCGMWFDHHSSEEERIQFKDVFRKIKGSSLPSPSCARVIYKYLSERDKLEKFETSGLLEAVDKSDSANLTQEEVLNPQGWILLSFIMDPRTGLGRYHDYRISNYNLMEEMIGKLRNLSLEEILADKDIQERIDRYKAQQNEYEAMVKSVSNVDGNVLELNLLETEDIKTGNRFTEYVMYPEQNISLRILWGMKKQNVVFSLGHSIMNRTSQTDVGALMLKHGGGGHTAVGTCQVPTENWQKVRDEILEVIKE
ncbi:MAG: exopolyphosphatase [Planctomycetes bacterium]|nr:exopolyphosphatase [Planctomycetota bacterium]